MTNELDTPASLDTLIGELRKSFTQIEPWSHECGLALRALDALEIARSQSKSLEQCIMFSDMKSQSLSLALGRIANAGVDNNVQRAFDGCKIIAANALSHITVVEGQDTASDVKPERALGDLDAQLARALRDDK